MKRKRGTGRNLREPPAQGSKRFVRRRSPRVTTADVGPTAPVEPPLVHRLYTQCPGCKTLYRMSLSQLRCGRGIAQCQQCQDSFNVLESLAETPARVQTEAAPTSLVMLGQLDAVTIPALEPIEGIADQEELDSLLPGRVKSPSSLLWTSGVFLSTAVLALQFGVFEGPRLVQNERLRPWLESACQILSCRLPGFRATHAIQIIAHDLHPAADGSDNYEFTLTVVNQASLPQTFPAVKLIVTAGNGDPIATRVFQPSEYLPNPRPTLMPVGILQEIRLVLAKPPIEMGGFTFELQ